MGKTRKICLLAKTMLLVIAILHCGWLPLNLPFIMPVEASTTVSLQVSDTENDYYNRDSDSWWSDSTANWVQIISGNDPIDGGFGFTSVEVPQGALITEAIISFYVFNTLFDNARMDIYGEDEDNGTSFGSGTTNFRDRNLTSASSQWSENNVGVGWHNVTVTDVVQEVINRTNWQLNNRLNLLALAKSGAPKSLYARDYYYDTSLAAKLYITFIAKPYSQNEGYTTNIIARNCTFSAYWTGDDLDTWIFSWNGTSDNSWENSSTNQWSGSPEKAWSNITKKLPPQTNRIVGWRIYANDTNGWGDTDIQTITLQAADYSSSRTLNIASSDIDVNTFEDWYLVSENYDFGNATGWSEASFTAEVGKWLYLKDIDTVTPLGYLRGYEVDAYDEDSASWVTPSGVWDKHGEETSYPATNFIDDDLGTSWRHDSGSDIHWIKLNFSSVLRISKVRIYVFNAEQGTHWQSVDIYIGKATGWNYNGTSPWIGANDFPTNYINTSKADRKIGNFSFETPTDTSTIFGNLTLSVNMSGSTSQDFRVEYQKRGRGKFWNEYWVWANTSWIDVTSSWTVVNVTLENLWWSAYHIEQMKIRFYSRYNFEVKIDKAWLTYTASNMTSMVNWVFDNMVARMVNDSFPLVRQYDEYDQEYTDWATPELLAGVLYYTLTDNTTMLSYTTKYVDWLNDTGNVLRLFQKYNVTGEYWEDPDTTSKAPESLTLQYLAAYVARNTTYIDLLQSAVTKYLQIWYPEDGTSRIYNNAFLNGTPQDTKLFAHTAARAVDALIYAGSVLNNQTVTDHAVNLAFNVTLSTYNLPYHQIFHNGSKDPTYDFTKQYTVGYYLLGLDSIYYWTANETVKNKIKDVAEYAAVAFWNSTLNRFVYRVESADNPPPPLGSGTQWTLAEKTMPVFHDSLMNSYLLWGNETWLDRLNSSWYQYIEVGDGLTNDLLTHQGSGSFESDPFAYGSTIRVASIYYNLNRTGWYQQDRFLDDISMLYGSTSNAHYGTLGMLGIQNASTYDWWYIGGVPKGGLQTPAALLAFFTNKTDAIINNFADYWSNFGDPFTGEVPPAILVSSDLGTNSSSAGDPVQFYSRWKTSQPPQHDLSMWRFYSNNTGVWENSSWTSTWDGTLDDAYARYNTTLNGTALVVQYKFYANDTLGNEYASSLSTVTMGETFTVSMDLDVSPSFILSFQLDALITLEHSLSMVFDRALQSSFIINLPFSSLVSYSHDLETTFKLVHSFSPNIDFTNIPTSVFNVAFQFQPSISLGLNAIQIIVVTLSLVASATFTQLEQWTSTLALAFNPQTDFSLLTQTSFNIVSSLSTPISFSLDIKQYVLTIVDLALPIETSFSLLTDWTTTILTTFNPNIAFISLSQWNAVVNVNLNPAISLTPLTQWDATLPLDFAPSIQWVLNAEIIQLEIVDLTLPVDVGFSFLSEWNAFLTLNFNPSFQWLLDVDLITGAQQFNVDLSFPVNVGFSLLKEWASTLTLALTPTISFAESLSWNAIVETTLQPAFNFALSFVQGTQYYVDLTFAVTVTFVTEVVYTAASVVKITGIGIAVIALVFAMFGIALALLSPSRKH